MDNRGQTSVAPDWCGKAEAPVEGLEYGRILQNQATCVMLLDQEFNVRYLNESAETLLHTSLRRAKGMPLNDLLRDDNQLKMACGKVAAEGGEIRLRNHICVLPSLVIEKRVDCIIKPVEQVHASSRIKPLYVALPMKFEIPWVVSAGRPSYWPKKPPAKSCANIPRSLFRKRID